MHRENLRNVNLRALGPNDVQTVMRYARLPIPELGLIAATRGMLGAGIALLLSDRISAEKRRKIGWPLVAIGVLSTAPLVWDVLKRRASE